MARSRKLSHCGRVAVVIVSVIIMLAWSPPVF